MADLITDREPSLLGDATATFSPCRTWRYALTRRWEYGVEGICFLMLNPSTELTQWPGAGHGGGNHDDH